MAYKPSKKMEEQWKKEEEARLARRQALIDKVQAIKHEPVETPAPVTYAPNQSDKKDKKDLKKANDRIEQLSKELAKLKIKNKELATESYDAREAYRLEREETAALREKVASLELQTKGQRKELELMSDHAFKTEIASLEKQLKDERSTISSLKTKLAMKLKEIQNLKHRVEYMETIDTESAAAVVLKANQAITRKSDEIQRLREKIAAGNTPGEMIKTLIKLLDKVTVTQYKHIDLLFKEVVTRRSIPHEHQIGRKPVPLAVPEPVDVELPEYLLGVVRDFEGTMQFKDLHGQFYKFEDQDLAVEDGTPAQVVLLNPITVALVRIYPYEQFQRQYMKKINQERTRTRTEIREGLQDLNVLVVGSRNKNVYMAQLKLHGINPIWFDSYAENITRLEYEAVRADIVIICTAHTSHSALDHLDMETDKVQLLYPDNKESLIARVYYAAHTMGLVKQTPLEEAGDVG